MVDAPESYKDLIRHLAKVITEAADETGEPLGPVMVASDLAAEVIFAMPREAWMGALDLVITRLGNTMDRRAKDLAS